MQSTQTRLTYVAAISALLIWSGTAVANKIAIRYLDGLSVGVLRSMVAGFAALPVVLVLGYRLPSSGRQRCLLVLSGLCSFVLWPVFMSVGIQHTTVGDAAVIMALIPILTVLVGSAAQRRAPALSWWLGASLAFAGGVLLLVHRGIFLPAVVEGVSLRGDLWVLLGAVLCAIGYASGARVAQEIGTMATTFLGLSISLPLLAPIFLLCTPLRGLQRLPLEFWSAVAWMAWMSSLVGYGLWFFALSRGGIARIATLQLAMPVCSLAFAALLLQESITDYLGLACLIILSGVYIAQRKA